jgi:hypothetical protein
MGFHGQKHDILLTEFCRIIAGADGHGQRFITCSRKQRQAISLYGLEMGATRNRAGCQATIRQPHRQQTADRTTAIYADFHSASPTATIARLKA